MSSSFINRIVLLVTLVASLTAAQELESFVDGPENYNNEPHTIVKRGLLDMIMPPPPGQQQQLQPQQQQQQLQQVGAPGTGNDFLSSLASQAQQILAAQQLIQSAQQLFQGGQTQTNQVGPQQIDSGAINGQQAGQEVVDTGRRGFRAALQELGQGIQRLTQTNPNLIPEMRRVYQRVTSTLRSSPPPTPNPDNPYGIVPARNAEEVADNLGKVVGVQPAQPQPAYPDLSKYMVQ